MYPACNWAGEGECPNLIAYLSSIREAQDDVDISMLKDDADTAEGVDPRWAALLDLRERMEGAE